MPPARVATSAITATSYRFLYCLQKVATGQTIWTDTLRDVQRDELCTGVDEHAYIGEILGDQDRTVGEHALGDPDYRKIDCCTDCRNILAAGRPDTDSASHGSCPCEQRQQLRPIKWIISFRLTGDDQSASNCIKILHFPFGLS